MILSPSKVASIAGWLSFWEYAEYLSEAAVALGCVGEYIADYAKWASERWTEEERHRIGRRSLFVLILGLGLSLVCLIKTNSLSGQVIGSLGEEVSAAGQKAKLASSAADSAARDANFAKGEAADAQSASSKAKEIAEKARSEADSFERDIDSAKRKATDAESHLANAYNRAASADQRALQAQRSLDVYRTPRTLTRREQEQLASKIPLDKALRVDIAVAPHTFEGDKFAEELLLALQGKWNARSFGGDTIWYLTGVTEVSGIMIFPTHDRRSIEAANILIEVLRSGGKDAIRSDEAIPNKFLSLPCNPKDPPDPACSMVLVVVGSKP